MLYEVITLKVQMLNQRDENAMKITPNVKSNIPELPMADVITSYSIHYTKLYDSRKWNLLPRLLPQRGAFHFWYFFKNSSSPAFIAVRCDCSSLIFCNASEINGRSCSFNTPSSNTGEQAEIHEPAAMINSPKCMAVCDSVAFSIRNNFV